MSLLPYCGKNILGASVFCDQCGKRVLPVSAYAPPTLDLVRLFQQVLEQLESQIENHQIDSAKTVLLYPAAKKLYEDLTRLTKKQEEKRTI